MGETTGIAWTDHTLNPWTRCTRVSPGCDNCYAATWANRARHPIAADGRALPLWGPEAPRDETRAWETSLRRWNAAAKRDGVRRRVFCASLADVFEDHPLITRELRERVLYALLCAEWLDVQLLTKRPQNVPHMVPASWLRDWPSHVWMGTTVEDQQRADERIPHLLCVPAAVRFLSVEPQIGPVDLDPPTCPTCGGHDAATGDDGATPFCREHGDEMTFGAWLDPCADARQPGISWVIQGGESGSKARPFDLAWMFDMQAQCKAAGVPWFPKQAGARPVYDGIPVEMSDSHGGEESEWPKALRGCRAFPGCG